MASVQHVPTKTVNVMRFHHVVKFVGGISLKEGGVEGSCGQKVEVESKQHWLHLGGTLPSVVEHRTDEFFSLKCLLDFRK